MDQTESRMIRDLDIQYTLFRIYLRIVGFLGLGIALVHIINQRPIVNSLTGFVIMGLSIFWLRISTEHQRYALSRITFMVFFTFIWIPLGYITSPGSYSAMPYFVLLAAFLLTLVARAKWEYLFPLSILVQIPILMRTEIWYPHWYYRYTDEVYRLNDLTINFTITALALILTSMYMMRRYEVFNAMLINRSTRDDLTGLYIKGYFTDLLTMEFNRSQRNNSPFTLVFIDLNNFKSVNDRFGHLTGDRVLRDFAQCISHSIRSYDIAARYGGDEFIIVFPNTQTDEAIRRMEELSLEFQKIFQEFESVHLSICWGISESTGKTLVEIIGDADQMVYEKKRQFPKV